MINAITLNKYFLFPHKNPPSTLTRKDLYINLSEISMLISHLQYIERWESKTYTYFFYPFFFTELYRQKLHSYIDYRQS